MLSLKLIFPFLLTAILFAQSNPDLQNVERLMQQSRDEDAKTFLQKLYKQDKKNPEINYYLGVIALRSGEYDEAIDYLDDAISLDEQNHKYYLMLGNAYGVKAQNAGMVKAMLVVSKIKSNYEKAVELKADYIPARFALFQFYLIAPGVMGGDKDKALENARQTFQLDKDMGHAMLASYYLQADKNYEAAETELNLISAVDSSNANYRQIRSLNINLLNSLGYHYLNSNDKQKSRRYFALSIRKAPEIANSYDSMGDYFTAEAKYDSALVYYEKALKINPKFNAAKFNKAQTLENLGQKWEARKIYTALANDDPDGRYGKQAKERLEKME